MSDWKVTWWDGSALRVTIVPSCDVHIIGSIANSMGVNSYSIIKIERIPR